MVVVLHYEKAFFFRLYLVASQTSPWLFRLVFCVWGGSLGLLMLVVLNGSQASGMLF